MGRHSERILYPRDLAKFVADFLYYIYANNEVPPMEENEEIMLGRALEELSKKVGIHDNVHWGSLRGMV